MSTHFRVSSLIRPRLLDLRISPEAVLRQAGLPLGFFDQEKIYVETRDFFALWQAIADHSGDPAIGLKLGDEPRMERYDPIAISTLYTRSFRDAIERAGRYKRLMCPEDIRVIPRGDECAIRFDWTMARGTEPPMLTDMCFAWVLCIARRGSGRPITPLRVEFERPPSNRTLYEKHFGCTVRFKADRNAFVFRKSDMDRPFLTYNPDLLAALAPPLEAELAYQQAQESPVEQVKTTIKRLLAGQRPDLAQVARELGQSPRTLQRRLTTAGVTFQQVLARSRQELAKHYLIHSGRELNETAYLLGYEDANSFFRAFQQWEGISPGRWREKHLKAPPLRLGARRK
ncbi:MAG: AraC family transcriptional regulator [Verrucomicrobia bacterium]|nr:AraC family transcriptional regulator [Verrucomicrobiota bacterium]